MYIISACLTGENCKYNGGNNRCEWVLDFIKDKAVVEICPEVIGGLGTPRPPAELVGSRVINKEGQDVTEAFETGAANAYEIAASAAEKMGETIEGAILKANSPSCGCGEIYDGTFSGIIIAGDGCFAKVLKEKGISTITEKDDGKLL